MSTLSVFDARREAPDDPAVIIGNDVWTFAMLADGVARLVESVDFGSIPEHAPVPIVGTCTIETLEMLYALFELGRPALLLHPRWTEQERATLLDRIRSAGNVPWSENDERALAILHTSGTTGAPRGVVLSRRAFVASARTSERNLGWSPADRWLLGLPLAHVGGLSVVTRCLLARKPVVIPTSLATRGHFEIEDIIECVQACRVTLLSLVPTQLAFLLSRSPEWNPPSHVRAILLGGAPPSPRHLAEAANRRWPILTTYGLTEACSQVTTLPPRACNRGALGAGLPLEEVEVRIAGAAIEVRGPTLLSGYYPPSPDCPSIVDPSQWFRTGDYGFFDDAGCLHVLGRRSDLIITGGENVHPLEVEIVLERVPGIAAACVFGLEDDTWGQIIGTALVLDDSGAFDEATLRRHVRSSLASFKRPRRYAILDALVLGPTGKVDRAATARKAEDRLALLDGI